MSEYIITDRQLGLIQDFANICVEGEKLPKIVRCRDCKRFHQERLIYNCEFKYPREENVYQWRYIEPDGYCPFGEMKKL